MSVSAALTGSSGPDFGIYVHWPFCKAKCPYCDFNSHVRHEAVDAMRYARALVRELQHVRQFAPDRKVTSIFFGGGTPSLMPPAAVGQVLDARFAAPLALRKLLTGVDRVAGGKLGELVVGDEGLAELDEGIGEDLRPAVGVAENDAAAVDVVAELGLILRREAQGLAAGDVCTPQPLVKK